MRKPAGEEPATQANSEVEAQEESWPDDASGAISTNDPSETDAEVGEGSVANTPTAEPVTMEIAYHVTGERRKELVKAISQITNLPATYQNAPPSPLPS